MEKITKDTSSFNDIIKKQNVFREIELRISNDIDMNSPPHVHTSSLL